MFSVYGNVGTFWAYLIASTTTLGGAPIFGQLSSAMEAPSLSHLRASLEKDREKLSLAFSKSTRAAGVAKEVRDVTVFISYAMADSHRLHITEIANELGSKPEISKVHFWEGWSGFQ